LGCKDEKHLSAPLPSLISSYKDEKHLSKPLAAGRMKNIFAAWKNWA
jgi:hypothetical protein